MRIEAIHSALMIASVCMIGTLVAGCGESPREKIQQQQIQNTQEMSDRAVVSLTAEAAKSVATQIAATATAETVSQAAYDLKPGESIGTSPEQIYDIPQYPESKVIKHKFESVLAGSTSIEYVLAAGVTSDAVKTYYAAKLDKLGWKLVDNKLSMGFLQMQKGRVMATFEYVAAKNAKVGARLRISCLA